MVKREFRAAGPNRLRLTDITEFSIPAGKACLSPIIDCFDGMCAAWAQSTSPNAALVNTMLDAAASKPPEDERPVSHSDRGCHYRWPGWIERCERCGITRSMSKKGCSLDNSAMKGFFGRLKVEFFYGRDWSGWSIDGFTDALDEYIRWYNEEKIKISLRAISSMQYRRSLGARGMGPGTEKRQHPHRLGLVCGLSKAEFVKQFDNRLGSACPVHH